MSEARIEFSIGAISFVGEGDQDWVATQLDKILDKAPDLVKLAPKTEPLQPEGATLPQHLPMEPDYDIAQKTLPSFLNETGANKSQVKKFLATAVWLEAKGQNRLSTSDITKALRESKQSRLSNASEYLNQNISKGYCEKDGKEFFVTQEGRNSL